MFYIKLKHGISRYARMCSESDFRNSRAVAFSLQIQTQAFEYSHSHTLSHLVINCTLKTNLCRSANFYNPKDNCSENSLKQERTKTQLLLPQRQSILLLTRMMRLACYPSVANTTNTRESTNEPATSWWCRPSPCRQASLCRDWRRAGNEFCAPVWSCHKHTHTREKESQRSLISVSW